MKRQYPGRRQGGFSLIELVLVLTIIGAITIITISAYNSSSDTQVAQEEVNNINALSGAVRNMFNTQGSYEGLTNTVILQAVSFPEQMRVPGSNTLIRHAWLNDGIDVAPDNFLGTADDSFTITYKDVPDVSCASMVSSTFRAFLEVTVNGSAITNVGEATAACTNGTNDIVYTAR